MKKRSLYYGLVALPLLLAFYLSAAGPEVTVYKVSTCGCCAKWVEHLKAAGFSVTVHEIEDTTEISRKSGVPEQMHSCHTALVDGYTIEGHVPASDIQRLLKERPQAKGLAVPGMPLGSPGMEGSRKDAYDVMLFTEDGKTSVFQKYAGN
jgi:hypothetical protein